MYISEFVCGIIVGAVGTLVSIIAASVIWGKDDDEEGEDEKI